MPSQRLPATTWHHHVAQWRSSGLTPQAYAEQSAISVERLTYWTRRLAREVQVTPLLPVVVRGTPATESIQLHSPSGWTMQFRGEPDPLWLATLLTGLR
jgi:hypothetical protein